MAEGAGQMTEGEFFSEDSFFEDPLFFGDTEGASEDDSFIAEQEILSGEPAEELQERWENLLEGSLERAAADLDFTSGQSGGTITWSFDAKTGLLRFEGTGVIEALTVLDADGIEYQIPLENSFDEQVQQIRIGEGITSAREGVLEAFTRTELLELPASFSQEDAAVILTRCGSSCPDRFWLFVDDAAGTPVYKGYLVDPSGKLIWYVDSDRRPAENVLRTREDVREIDLSIFDQALANWGPVPDLYLHENVTLSYGPGNETYDGMYLAGVLVYPNSQADQFARAHGMIRYAAREYDLLEYDITREGAALRSEPMLVDYLREADIAFTFANTAEAFGYPSDYYFPEERFDDAYASSELARRVYQAKRSNDLEEWGGNCFGMCAASLLLHIEWYEFMNYKKDGWYTTDQVQVTCDDSRPCPSSIVHLNMNRWDESGAGLRDLPLSELIELLQIGQLSDDIQSQYRQWKNKLPYILPSLSEEGKEMVEPFLVMISDGATHVMMAYACEHTSADESRLYVYDPDSPGSSRSIRFSMEGGMPTGWTYTMADGTLLTSDHSRAVISKVHPMWVRYMMMDMGRLMITNSRAVLLPTRCAIDVVDEGGETLARVRDGAFTSFADEIYQAVTISGRENDPVVVFYMPEDDTYRLVNQSTQEITVTWIGSDLYQREETLPAAQSQTDEGAANPQGAGANETSAGEEESKTGAAGAREADSKTTKTQKADSTGKKWVLKVSANVIPLKKGQSTTRLGIAMAKGDRIARVKSSNKKIAAVSIKNAVKGKIRIKGKKVGKCKVKITLRSGLSKTVTVRVKKNRIKTRKISVEWTGLSSKAKSSTLLKIRAGSRRALRVSLQPFTTKDKITYQSTAPGVASVSKKGVIRAKKAGKARIIIRAGSKKKVVRVRVL